MSKYIFPKFVMNLDFFLIYILLLNNLSGNVSFSQKFPLKEIILKNSTQIQKSREGFANAGQSAHRGHHGAQHHHGRGHFMRHGKPGKKLGPKKIPFSVRE